MLARASVFSGSFDLAAAESICVGDDVDELEVLDALERLIDHSLVTALDHDAYGQFLLLETVRQFAGRLIDAAGETESLRSRHADLFAALVHEVAPRAQTADQNAAVARLTADIDNIRTALAFQQHQADPQVFASMVCDLAPFWDQASMFDEAISWLTRALDALPDRPSALRGQLFAHRAEARFAVPDLGCLGDAQAAAEIGEVVGDLTAISRGRWTLAAFWAYVDYDTFEDASHAAVAALAAANDHYALADAMSWRCLALWTRGRITEAITALENARPLVVALDNPHLLAMFWGMEAEIAFLRGDLLRVGSLADRAHVVLTGTTYGGPVNVRLRADHLLGIESPLLAELAPRAELARRSNDWLAAGLHDNARVQHFLRADPCAALTLATQLVDRTGLLPMQDAAAYAYHALAALGAGMDDLAWASALTAEEQSTLSQSVIMTPFIGCVKALVLSARAEHLAAVGAACDAIQSSAEHGMRVFIHVGLDVLALVAQASGDHIEAARLHGAALAEQERLGIVHTFAPFDRRCADSVRLARTALGDEAFDDACGAGAAQSLDDAVAYALRARGERRRPTTGWDSLTPTELQVIEHVRTGRTNREVADHLLMGVETVKTHLSHVFTKLGTTNRSQLTALATERAERSRISPTQRTQQQ